MMLSLPEDWTYTTRGLAAICKEGVDAIGGALRELEAAGYIVRHQLRDKMCIRDRSCFIRFVCGRKNIISGLPENACYVRDQG